MRTLKPNWPNIQGRRPFATVDDWRVLYQKFSFTSWVCTLHDQVPGHSEGLFSSKVSISRAGVVKTEGLSLEIDPHPVAILKYSQEPLPSLPSDSTMPVGSRSGLALAPHGQSVSGRARHGSRAVVAQSSS